jgi:hypothetical protein
MYSAACYISWKEKTCTLDVKAEALWQLAKCQLFDKAAGFLLASLHTLLKQTQQSSTFLAFSVNTVVHNPATYFIWNRNRTMVKTAMLWDNILQNYYEKMIFLDTVP